MNGIIYENDLFGFEFDCSIQQRENGLVVFGKSTDDNKHIVKFLATGPRFDIISKAFEDATYINHITGEPFVRTSILYKLLFSQAIKKIDFVDYESLDSIEVSKVDINNLNYNLVKLICKKWLGEV